MQAYPRLHDTLARLFNHLEHSDDETGVAMAQEAIDLLPRWIPVTERLPEIEGEYLVRTRNGYTLVFDWIWSEFQDLDGPLSHNDVTHWMPLPDPPEAMTYICTDCGKNNQHHPPRQVTMHRGKCDKCGKVGDLCHIRHYNWMRK